ncbi:hypothetical protein EV401DRAFT_1893615 [Pisolithus croceorrhizus]|nr:hypothetical protein EV401DRAFT_1893615 [Pisolithus croceorrhizus]
MIPVLNPLDHRSLRESSCSQATAKHVFTGGQDPCRGGEGSAGLEFYSIGGEKADTCVRQHVEVDSAYPYRENSEKAEVHPRNACIEHIMSQKSGAYDKAW